MSAAAVASREALAIMEAVRDAILQYANEDDLQAEIKTCLDEAGIDSTREVRLSDKHSRIDLLSGHIGIEVKLKGSWGEVVKQLQRYAHCDEVDELILITTRHTHSDLPPVIGGIPISSLYLPGALL